MNDTMISQFDEQEERYETKGYYQNQSQGKGPAEPGGGQTPEIGTYSEKGEKRKKNLSGKLIF